jgi:hypothetical protein
VALHVNPLNCDTSPHARRMRFHRQLSSTLAIVCACDLLLRSSKRQLETVTRREGLSACAMTRLRDSHATLYWNFVVLAVVTALDCDLAFLRLPTDAVVQPSINPSTGASSLPLTLAASSVTGSGPGRLMVRTDAGTPSGMLGVHVGTVVSTTAAVSKQRGLLTRHRSMIPQHGRMTSPKSLGSGNTRSTDANPVARQPAGATPSVGSAPADGESLKRRFESLTVSRPALAQLQTDAVRVRQDLCAHRQATAEQFSEFQALLTSAMTALTARSSSVSNRADGR